MQGGAYELEHNCHGFDKLLEYMRRGKLPSKLDVDDLVCKAANASCVIMDDMRLQVAAHGVACASGNYDDIDAVCMLCTGASAAYNHVHLPAGIAAQAGQRSSDVGWLLAGLGAASCCQGRRRRWWWSVQWRRRRRGWPERHPQARQWRQQRRQAQMRRGRAWIRRAATYHTPCQGVPQVLPSNQPCC